MREREQSHTRRVTLSTETDDDVWSRLENEAESEIYGADSLGLLGGGEPRGAKKKKKKKRKKAAAKARTAPPPARDIRERHQRSQKQQRLFVARVRAAAAFIAALIIIAAVMFVTPVFNVRGISVSGNTLISAEQVSQLVGDVKGTNLFLANKNSMKKQLKTIKYINEVEITKSMFPPQIDIAVTEYIPAGYIQVGVNFLILDRSMYIIDAADATADLSEIPCVIGIKVKKSEVGSTLIPESDEVGKAVRTFLEIMQQNGETANIVSADFSNMNSITFNYRNRLNVSCGTQIDLDRKLRLFCETITNENISENARGTIDLSTTGRAIYTP